MQTAYKLLALRPIVHQLTEHFLAGGNLLFDLVDGLGSPLNILFPQIAAENMQKFLDTYAAHDLPGRVFYAHKPNKSQAVVRELAVKNCGIDVASFGEFTSALEAGFTGDRIEVTGVKDSNLIRIALLHNALINVDSVPELETVIDLHKKLNINHPARIMVRLNGFRSDTANVLSKDSRFGISIDEMPNHCELLMNDHVNFIGFSFHLENNNPTEKLIAIEATLKLTLLARDAGLNPTTINIGGGFTVGLLAHQEDWDEYISHLKLSVIGRYPSLSWNNSGLGYRNENGTLAGAPNFREHFIEAPGADQLNQLLETRLPAFGNQAFAALLLENLLELYIEPGKAMLDQVGITVAKVLHTKPSSRGEQMVVLAMNKSNLNASEMELMSDPIVISHGKSKNIEENSGVFFCGNLCSYSDLIYKHKTFLKILPQAGDLVVFINTAGYSMDFVESNTLQQPIAEKISVCKRNGTFSWTKDGLYNPV